LQSSQDLLKNVLPLLQPTAEATKILSADTYISASLIIPCISVLKEELSTRSASVVAIQCFRRELLCQLNTRFDLSKKYLIAATFVDPRFKTALLTENETTEAVAYLKTLSASRSGSSDTLPVPDDLVQGLQVSPESAETVEFAEPHRGSLLDSVFKKVDSVQKESATNIGNTQFEEKFQSEVSTYLKQPVSECQSDPLQYWKANKNLLPLLTAAARDLLCIQATNCSSERVNSVGGQIIADMRHNLSKTNAEMLIWARHNRHMIC